MKSNIDKFDNFKCKGNINNLFITILNFIISFLLKYKTFERKIIFLPVSKQMAISQSARAIVACSL